MSEMQNQPRKKHRVVIAGGRDFIHNEFGFQILDKLTSKFDKSRMSVICGEARGADTVGKNWARSRSVDVESFPADWDTHGKAAGYIRNAEMAERGTHLIVFWDGESRGTRNMIEVAKEKGLTVRVIKYHTVTIGTKTYTRRGWADE